MRSVLSPNCRVDTYAESERVHFVEVTTPALSGEGLITSAVFVLRSLTLTTELHMHVCSFPCCAVMKTYRFADVSSVVIRPRVIMWAFYVTGLSRALVILYEHCLLYTSPSPRDDNRSRMPSSA